MTATGSIGRDGVLAVLDADIKANERRIALDRIHRDEWERLKVIVVVQKKARAAVAELIEAADCPHANIIFRENGPGYVTVPADDWNRLRAALARCEPQP